MNAPPPFAERLIRAAIRDAEWREAVTGDLREEFSALAARHGATIARRWYWRQAVALALRFAAGRLRPGAVRTRRWEIVEAEESRGWFSGLRQDVTYAARTLRQRPALTGAMLVALSLGLAANATIFTLADAIVLRPHRLPGVDRAVMVTSSGRHELEGTSTVAPADFLDWQAQATAFERLAAVEAYGEVTITGDGEPLAVPVGLVTPEFLSVLQVSPTLGRDFLAAEGVPGGPRVVILSDMLWRVRYQSDPGIIGRSLLIDGAPAVVIGVAPPRFSIPMGSRLWMPFRFDETMVRQRERGWLMVMGRLAEGVTIARADAEMQTLVEAQRRAYPETNANRVVSVLTFNRGMGDPGAANFVAVWQAAALLLLLLGSANVGNLLLARGAERQQELAMRMALGASRWRVLRQLIIEGGLLAALAALLSVPLAMAGIAASRTAIPESIQRYVPGWDHLYLQPRPLLVMAALAVAATMLFALAPAVQAIRTEVLESLRQGTRTATAGRGRQWLRAAFATTQIALALALLTAAVLSVGAARRAVSDSLGFEPARVMTARLTLPETAYAEPEARRQFADRVLTSLAGVPAITDAAVSNTIPYAGFGQSRPFWPEGVALETAEVRQVDYRRITPGYFATMGLPLRSGRLLTEADHETSAPVAVVSEMLAERYWPGADPLGQRFRLDPDGPPFTVVGVVGDVMQDWFMRQVSPTVYRSLRADPPTTLFVVARTPGHPLDLAGALRTAINAGDPQQPITRLQTYDTVIADKTAGIRFAASTLTTMGVMALFLAVMGIYSVMSYLASRRTQEIGVRMALGATAGDVVRLALRQAVPITAGGTAIGLVLALAVGKTMESVMFGIVSGSVATTLGVALVLASAAFVASYLPARRAARLDPTTALKAG
ncbi:MAG: ADOP family duplicated permease [Vicinamibacterales bacterium]|nr:ADOP family duplicated permease [Vicinamibacterales bacterium]